MDALGSHFLEEVRRQLRGYKRMAEGAIAQVTDEQLLITLDPESNSIAILVKHLSGNMRSRFTDFLISDGEKPDRFRDREFDLTFTMGVLIHVPPDDLPRVMAEILRCSRRYILCGEYHAVEPTEVRYRGRSRALCARDLPRAARHKRKPRWAGLEQSE